MDDTQAAETGLVETGLAEPVVLAWAQTEPEPVRRGRGERWRWVAAITLVWLALLAVGALCVMGYPVSQPSPPHAASAPPVPSPSAVAAPPPTAVSAAPQDPDARFLSLVRDVAGIKILDQAAVINDGHKICDTMATYGDTISSMTTGIVQATPGGPSLTQERAIVTAAVSVYCPQFTERP